MIVLVFQRNLEILTDSNAYDLLAISEIIESGWLSEMEVAEDDWF